MKEKVLSNNRSNTSSQNETVTQLETFAEAVGNIVTHGLGALLSIAALIILLVFSAEQNNALKIFSSAVYGSSLVAMFAASTLYHSFRYSRFRRVLRTLDHSTIYFLIAGTYTPLTLITLDGTWGWPLFSIVWAIAIFGISFKLIFGHRYEILSTVLYLVMGWLCVVAIKPLWDALPAGALIWIALGGLAYTGGVVFYLWERLRFGHTIWHVFVLIGSLCHFFAILFYVIL